ncbi:MAG: pitrilysin family protein [bacterium]|nr:pitrilysin family protein [bacterium]
MKTLYSGILLILLFATSVPANTAVSKFRIDGLDVLLKRVENTPVVSAVLYLKGGSAVLKPEQAGIEQFLFTVAQRGTRNYPKDKLNAALARMGTQIGADAQFDYTGLTMQCLREHFDNSWSIFADVVQYPVLDSTEVERVREQMLTALKQETENPDDYVSRIANDLLFAGHPYEVYRNGSETSVSAITRQDLRAYHRQRLSRSRMLLVVVGDLDEKTLKQKIKSSLTVLRKGKYSPPNLPALLARDQANAQVVERQIPTNYVIGYYPAPGLTSPDFYPFMIATRLLRDWLWEEVRTKRNLSYAVSSGYSQRTTNFGYLYFNAVEPDTTLKVSFEQVRKLQNEPISRKELADQISMFITSYFLRLETASSQNEFLARYELMGNGWEDTERFVDNLRQVTPEDIQRVARKYMQHYHFGIVGNPEKIDMELFKSM